MSAISVMDTDALLNLCRCCLSPNTIVSLVEDEFVIQKFVDITTLQIDVGDGLPQMLCADCNAIMNSACQFRNQCIKMDSELRYQLDNLQKSVEESDRQTQEDDDVDFASNPLKQLEAIIKKEPRCEDEEDDYYVVVVNPKDAESKDPTPQIKEEVVENNSESPPTQTKTELEDKIVSFISDTKVPVNVPDTILENEEGTEQEIYDSMDVDEMTNMSQEETIPMNEDSQEIPDSCTLEGYTSALVKDIQSNNIIKILTASKDGTILLQNSEGIEYLADGQLITNEDGDDLLGQEVIYCEGNESQFQILKCDGSELVIEYANDGQIATVLQQEDGTFLCDCGAQFEDLSEYEKHQITHHTPEEYTCNLCGKTMESEEILAGHTLLHSNTNLQVPCPICNLQVKRSALTQHIKYYHNNIKPSCHICEKTFANQNNLKRHMIIHTGVRDFICDVCNKGFNQKIALQMHKLTHMNPYACNQCEMTFDKKDDLIHHKESDECSKSKLMKIKDELMKTIKQIVKTNAGKELGFACSLCKKMFSVESALGQHIEKFHLTDPIDCLCADCGEVLPSKRDMQSHMLAHKTYRSKNAKRFECSSCKKGCSSQAMLIMHERVHTNERPYPCQLCLLRFKTKTHLRTHQLTHTREKKFGCSVCMKFFALKGNLVVHLRTHTGERPYVCDLCNESFIDSKYLKKHKIKKHNLKFI